MKSFRLAALFAAVLAVSASFGFAADAQVINPSKGVDVSGNAKSSIITIYNQSSSTIIAIACGPNRIPFARPIPPDAASNVNFGSWSCPNGSHIVVFTTGDSAPHFIPFVDVRASTLIRIPDHWGY